LGVRDAGIGLLFQPLEGKLVVAPVVRLYGASGGDPMVMAGLWDAWKSPASGEEIVTCTVLTCEPNKSLGEIHDRMPVILAEADWPQWLDEEPASEEELLALLRPCPDDALKIWPVDNKVGNVRNTGPELVRPLEPIEPTLL
jgi:putative SOS response-associated peptidase YedK